MIKAGVRLVWLKRLCFCHALNQGGCPSLIVMSPPAIERRRMMSHGLAQCYQVHLPLPGITTVSASKAPCAALVWQASQKLKDFTLSPLIKSAGIS